MTAISGVAEINFEAYAAIRRSANALEARTDFKQSRVTVYATASLTVDTPPVDSPESFVMQFSTNISMPPVTIGEDGKPL